MGVWISPFPSSPSHWVARLLHYHCEHVFSHPHQLWPQFYPACGERTLLNLVFAFFVARFALRFAPQATSSRKNWTCFMMKKWTTSTWAHQVLAAALAEPTQTVMDNFPVSDTPRLLLCMYVDLQRDATRRHWSNTFARSVSKCESFRGFRWAHGYFRIQL